MKAWRWVRRGRRGRGWRGYVSSPQSLEELEHAVKPPVVIWVLVRDDHIGYVYAIWGRRESVIVSIYEGPFEDGDILGRPVSCVEKDIRRFSPEEIRVCSCARDPSSIFHSI